MRIGKWDHDAFVAVVKDFHGHVAPGVIIGGYMVEMARRTLPEGILYDAVSETVQCLPDAIQLLTPFNSSSDHGSGSVNRSSMMYLP